MSEALGVFEVDAARRAGATRALRDLARDAALSDAEVRACAARLDDMDASLAECASRLKGIALSSREIEKWRKLTARAAKANMGHRRAITLEGETPLIERVVAMVSDAAPDGWRTVTEIASDPEVIAWHYRLEVSSEAASALEAVKAKGRRRLPEPLRRLYSAVALETGWSFLKPVLARLMSDGLIVHNQIAGSCGSGAEASSRQTPADRSGGVASIGFLASEARSVLAEPELPPEAFEIPAAELNGAALIAVWSGARWRATSLGPPCAEPAQLEALEAELVRDGAARSVVRGVEIPWSVGPDAISYTLTSAMRDGLKRRRGAFHANAGRLFALQRREDRDRSAAAAREQGDWLGADWFDASERSLPGWGRVSEPEPSPEQLAESALEMRAMRDRSLKSASGRAAAEMIAERLRRCEDHATTDAIENGRMIFFLEDGRATRLIPPGRILAHRDDLRPLGTGIVRAAPSRAGAIVLDRIAAELGGGAQSAQGASLKKKRGPQGMLEQDMSCLVAAAQLLRIGEANSAEDAVLAVIDRFPEVRTRAKPENTRKRIARSLEKLQPDDIPETDEAIEALIRRRSGRGPQRAATP